MKSLLKIILVLMLAIPLSCTPSIFDKTKDGVLSVKWARPIPNPADTLLCYKGLLYINNNKIMDFTIDSSATYLYNIDTINFGDTGQFFLRAIYNNGESNTAETKPIVKVK